MSRIGKLPIPKPKDVTITIEDNVITVKGPKGELKQEIKGDLSFEIGEDQILVKRNNESKETRAMHGLYRSLINNMVTGVSQGWKLVMELVGVGYRAAASGQKLEMSLGFSHNVVFQLPPEVKVTAVSERGKNPVVTFESHDKQLIGLCAAKLRSLRKPEPYKGKGIRFQGEEIRRKAGKTAAK